MVLISSVDTACSFLQGCRLLSRKELRVEWAALPWGNVEMWHLGTWFNGDGSMSGADDCRGLLQPHWFCDSVNVVGMGWGWTWVIIES